MPDHPSRQKELPIQPVEEPILSSPYEEPPAHWFYNLETGEASIAPKRRPASYWYTTKRAGTREQQLALFAEETREDLDLVNALREDVKRWRNSDYEGATQITKQLLHYWWRENRLRRLFFCQLEAAETVIFLQEIRLSKKYLRFKPEFTDEHLEQLKNFPADSELSPLTRLGTKMATGSGKTIVMAMLIAWAFCNRGKVSSDIRFPSGVLIVCPNLTIKDRLQVLRPEKENNYYDEFDIVPHKLRPLLHKGKVKITNWHLFQPESEHVEGDKSYKVVNKGPESPEAFARRVLGDLYDHSPIMVLNDEAHHAWRPNPETQSAGTEKVTKDELREATIWVSGLDTINQSVGISFCVDLSATPFYIQGSGYIEGSPFPWLISDFSLVDAIESGIVKIPRLPVSDTTGRPEPKYFRLWANIVGELEPDERLPGRAGKPKPEVIYREAEPALRTLAGQWVERYQYIQEASNEKDKTPPVLIIICDNTDIAEYFYRKISGEQEVEDIEQKGRRSRPKPRTVYGRGEIFPEYFSNQDSSKPTLRIDSKLLAKAESGDPNVSRTEAEEKIREIVSTVGKVGKPGEQIRCVVSVAMLNEGWDANNVTNIFGIRAFTSQLLCEQVVGRGLRRMDYSVDPETGRFSPEYVDIYGVPFSLIPFKGRPKEKKETEDKPKNHVRALPERATFEIRIPIVEGYVFALKKNVITADIGSMEPLYIEPEREPTAVFVKPRVGVQVGPQLVSGPGDFEEHNRQLYYESTHLQTIEFEIARQVVAELVGDHTFAPRSDSNPQLRLQSRHLLFPQVLRLVHKYVIQKVNFRGEDPRELGQEKYTCRIVERLRDAIIPDDSSGEPPLLPLLNRYTQFGSTADVDFKTTKRCYATQSSHINLVAADTARWEQSVAFRLEQAFTRGLVKFYARNEGLGLFIPYDFMKISHYYEPDFLVRMENDLTLILEVKGQETEQDRAKHQAARRWVTAVNNWGKLGQWDFHVNRDPQMLITELIPIAKK